MTRGRHLSVMFESKKKRENKNPQFLQSKVFFSGLLCEGNFSQEADDAFTPGRLLWRSGVENIASTPEGSLAGKMTLVQHGSASLCVKGVGTGISTY